MKIVQEEIFGPVMSVIPFKTTDEVVARANRTEYGLAAAVWTRDIKKAHAIANSVRAGTLWVNCHNILDTRAPFGGFSSWEFTFRCGPLHLLRQYKRTVIDTDNPDLRG